MVDLRHVRNISKIESPGMHTFAITCQDRNLILRANSAAEMNNWIRALHIHADIARGGTGMNVVSDFNETPLRSVGLLATGKNARSRNSLTLQQELDLNLRKLNELEQKLVNGVPVDPGAAEQLRFPSSTYSSYQLPTNAAESKYEMDSFEHPEQTETENYLYHSGSFGSSSNRTNHFTNIGGQDPSPPQVKKSIRLEGVKRSDSNGSIENISLNATPNVRSVRRSRQCSLPSRASSNKQFSRPQQIAEQDGEEEVAPAKNKAPRQAEQTRGKKTRNDDLELLEMSADEFEINADFEILPQKKEKQSGQRSSISTGSKSRRSERMDKIKEQLSDEPVENFSFIPDMQEPLDEVSQRAKEKRRERRRSSRKTEDTGDQRDGGSSNERRERSSGSRSKHKSSTRVELKSAWDA